MTLKNIRRGFAIATLAALVSVGSAHAADEFFISDTNKNIAINGYDAVAYHTAGKPVKGDANFKYEHMDVVWKFSSAENMAAFQADPAKFAPAYGGWCTVGASKGKKIATKPELFKVVDGQLYLNSSDGAHNLFLKDEAGTIDTADKNWTEIESKPASSL
ncbi:YHS domain-containing protein [Roseobacter denitrificans]|uniref:YHS domain protein n=1 Tax=Roseobacter denitrificans (strain ATCC 33942 / OCh 114) TaxID=375451 RepID=Q161Y2_ROSDO|nr:YHS domain-containing (seleno)protein [Roseobacter denitrificans]ABG33211.1 YHS domain protein [Roseobacter denitrificans OCh 114]AVL52560.1 YHS domain-containing protein [Roseobacter denitrificans]SFG29970.1 YHS domain-containing protein [Roseobacter denitrificans OCh 114]